VQQEACDREQRLSEMRRNLQTTDAELQTCLSSLLHEAVQLQHLDQQLSAVDTSAAAAAAAGTRRTLLCLT